VAHVDTEIYGRRVEHMKKQYMNLATVLFLATVVLAAPSCRVRQTEEGELPDVDVSAEGGKVPEYDVDAADVDVKTEKREVMVPDVDVTMPGEGEADEADERRRDAAVPPQLGPPPTTPPPPLSPRPPL
jgi:hypothetical protein